MPMRQPTRQRPGCASPHQPFFDAECRSLKRQVRTATPEERGALEQLYHSVVKRKKRAYRMARLQQLVDSHCLQQRSFWVKLRHHPTQLPMALQNVQSWDAFIAQVADARLPPALFLPDCAYPQQDPARAAALDADITVAEVVSQLPTLHNGRSAGHADLPAEFLRYARQPPQPNQPLAPHLLAPTLAKLFTTMMTSRDAPSSVNIALITPCHKRGSKDDPNNFGPIAVTHPLMRLYTGLLNSRQIQYTEEHSLRAPSQVGFRPGHSVIHQMFLCSIWWTRKSRLASACISAFWTWNLHTIGCLGLSFGKFCSVWACMATCCRLSRALWLSNCCSKDQWTARVASCVGIWGAAGLPAQSHIVWTPCRWLASFPAICGSC